MATLTEEPEALSPDHADETDIGAWTGGIDLDVQIATARRFPRSVSTFVRRALELATLTPEIAQACIYAVPRAGKTIEGPSVRFAELMMSAWGNMRAKGRQLHADDDFIYASAFAWDLESNTALASESKRRITDRHGRRYDADMIATTGNAAVSIALRNVVLRVIPSPFWHPIYKGCRRVIAGDAKTFDSRRENMLQQFAIMGVIEERICAALGVRGKLDITLDHMATLAGFFTAIKDGETTIEEAFPDSGGLGTPQPAQRKSQQQPPPNGETTDRRGDEARSREMPSPAAGTVGGPISPPITAPAPSAAPVLTGTIAAVLDKRPHGWLIKLSPRGQGVVRDESLVRAAEMAQRAGLLVTLTIEPARDAKYAPRITGLTAHQAGQ